MKFAKRSMRYLYDFHCQKMDSVKYWTN